MRFHIPTAFRMKLRGTCLAKLYSQSDRWLITLSNGRLGSRVRIGGGLPDPPVLVLETTGRRSGKQRGTPVMYQRHPNGFVVVASNAGHAKHPAWWLNLLGQPSAFVRVDGERIAVRARELHGDARTSAWNEFATMYPGLLDYQRGSARTFPVVLLEPQR
jgi:deazaflavin-dependent oxidoreductase (nitroreductase family)